MAHALHCSPGAHLQDCKTLQDQDCIACCRSCWQQQLALQGRTILIRHGSCHIQQLLHCVQPLLNLLHAPEAQVLGLEARGVMGRQLQTLLEAVSADWLVETPQTQETAAGLAPLAGADPDTCKAARITCRPETPRNPVTDDGVGLPGEVHNR